MCIRYLMLLITNLWREVTAAAQYFFKLLDNAIKINLFAFVSAAWSCLNK